jgi:hypothetical protein
MSQLFGSKSGRLPKKGVGGMRSDNSKLPHDLLHIVAKRKKDAE